MNDILTMARWSSEDYHTAKLDLKLKIDFRNNFILAAFEEGIRQKEIAEHCGLTESRVKHIIGQLRKGESK